MPKYYGEIGFLQAQVETAPGIYENQVVTKNYYGDLVRNIKRSENQGQMNDDVKINNSISIVADRFLNYNFHSILYVYFMGNKWKVGSVDASNPPRLILELGDLYTESSEDQ